jgi:hypothetical protein
MQKTAKRDAVKVYAAEGGDRIIRRTDLATAELHEAMGSWRREYDTASGFLKGFRVIGVELRREDSDLCTMHSTAAISANEMQVNVERSRTHGMRELQRLERAKAGRLPEDQVERVQAKVRVYAVIMPAKGDILRVWPR